MALRRRVILLNHFSPVLRHSAKAVEVLRGRFRGSNRLTRARVLSMAFPGLLLYHALRSSRVGVCERGVFGHGGVQFQANVLPRVSGGSISRGSVRREGKHRPHRPVEVWRDRADVRTGRRKRGRMRPRKGGAKGGKPSSVHRCATFAEKLPVFLLFTGTFVPKLALFSSCCAFSRDKSRGSTDERGRKRTRKRESVHSRRQKLVVSPFSCKFAAEIPALHSHFPLACGGGFNLPHERKTPHPRGAAECRPASPPSLDPRVVLRGGLRAVVALRHAHLW